MHITQWAEYGIHFALFIAEAEHLGRCPIGASEIAEAQAIDLQYAQQILQRLRKGGIILSVRGPQGGYRLARPPEQITVRDILLAAEGTTFELICDAKPISTERCAKGAPCGIRVFWRELRDHIDRFLVTNTLADLLAQSPRGEEPVQIGGKPVSA